jgi:hypothetical protein
MIRHFVRTARFTDNKNLAGIFMAPSEDFQKLPDKSFLGYLSS